MTKKDLIGMGLTDEQADKVMGALDGDYVTKSRFNEVNEELKTQKETVAERDKQLSELKKSAGDNEDLKKQIEDLQKANSELDKTHKAEIAQLKLDNAIDSALMGAGAKNVKAVKALLDTSKIKLDESDKLSGLDEQVKAFQESDAYLFNDTQNPGNQNQFHGFNPGDSGNVKPDGSVDTSKMTYSEMVAYLDANPNAKLD